MTHPEWKPHEHPDYDVVLDSQSAAALADLLAGGPAAAEAFMRDTREMHKRLYAALTPSSHPEYAGTYRGTPGTSLEKRRAGALLVNSEGTRFFIEPEKVKPFLDHALEQAINELISPLASDGPDQLIQRAVKVFYVFGMIHPYLDGNGHIQRLIFAAAVTQHPALRLLPSWIIHPRPYDIEMAAAFEMGVDALAAIGSLLAPHVGR
jgi:fido (protein-threonine AMPylation protein)